MFHHSTKVHICILRSSVYVAPIKVHSTAPHFKLNDFGIVPAEFVPPLSLLAIISLLKPVLFYHFISSSNPFASFLLNSAA